MFRWLGHYFRICSAAPGRPHYSYSQDANLSFCYFSVLVVGNGLRGLDLIAPQTARMQAQNIVAGYLSKHMSTISRISRRPNSTTYHASINMRNRDCEFVFIVFKVGV